MLHEPHPDQDAGILHRPIAVVAPHRGCDAPDSAINFVIARVTLEDGTTGEGYLLAFHFNPGAIRGALVTCGRWRWGAVSDTKAFNAECDKSFEYFGATGLLRWARGMVNLAMWDAWGAIWASRYGGCSAPRAQRAGPAAAAGCPTRSTNWSARRRAMSGAASPP